MQPSGPVAQLTREALVADADERFVWLIFAHAAAGLARRRCTGQRLGASVPSPAVVALALERRGSIIVTQVNASASGIPGAVIAAGR